MQHQALALDPGQSTDARPDRNPGAQARGVVHVEEARIFDCLPRRVDSVDDEIIDLPLDLVVDALVRIEAIFMICGLHFTGDAAFLVAGVELGDRSSAALRSDDIFPARLDVGAKWRHQPETCHHDTAHLLYSVPLTNKRPPERLREAVDAAANTRSAAA
jgi:hypothetical protein